MVVLFFLLLFILAFLGLSEVQPNLRQREVNERKISSSGYSKSVHALHSTTDVRHQQPQALTSASNLAKTHQASAVSRHTAHPHPHVPVTRKSHLEYPMTEEMHKFVDPPLYQTKSIANLDLIIVYNGLIYPKRRHWLEMMREQLDEFNCNGMADRAKKIYISLSIDLTSEWGKDSDTLVNSTTAALAKILPKAEFDITYENRFEYPGIHKMWDVAQRLSKKEATNTILVYFHAKGMVNTHMSSEFHGVRTPFEVNLFHKTFDPWPEVFAKFNQHPELNKVGCYTDATGVVWYNVFYARASYVQTLVRPPVLLDNRFFYELWLRCIDGDRKPPGAATAQEIAVPEKDVKLPKIINSGCADCWSTCANTDPLGAHFESKNLHLVEHPKLFEFDWYKCRKDTVLPRPEVKFSTNQQNHLWLN